VVNVKAALWQAERVELYYLGIIDVLQEFTLRKKLESAYKVQMQTLFGQDPTLVSALPPSQYASRCDRAHSTQSQMK
jgi:hypothetical protein